MSYHRYDRDYCETYGDYDDEPEPEEGEEVQSLYRATTHTARRDHGDGRIKKGDRYRRVVTGGYIVGGARWMRVSKFVLTSPVEVAA